MKSKGHAKPKRKAVQKTQSEEKEKEPDDDNEGVQSNAATDEQQGSNEVAGDSSNAPGASAHGFKSRGVARPKKKGARNVKGEHSESEASMHLTSASEGEGSSHEKGGSAEPSPVPPGFKLGQGNAKPKRKPGDKSAVQ